MAKCYTCRKAEMVTEAGTFEYEQANLPYKVILVGVPVQTCPSCEEQAVTIPDPEGLHRALCLAITEADRTLLPQEVRFLRKYLDWSAEKLAAVMGIDAKTLSRWENGKQKMGSVAERLLRLLVHHRLKPDTQAFTEELLSKLVDRPTRPPAPVKFTASRRGWEQAA
jgi:putative zinc finger/helix-turn-helix YgiT family protein